MKNKIIIGLTGQTGSGKSSLSSFLSDNGLYVIDCDRVSRAVTDDGSECCRKLREYFPSCIDEKLHLNRKALASVVFNDTQKLELLNELIFPFILSYIRHLTNNAFSNGFDAVVLDAPTLFESSADKECSLIISCTADKKVRLERIMKRDGLTEQQAQARISSQKSESFYKESSDIIIENGGGIDSLDRAADFLALRIKEMLYGIKH